MKTKLIRRNREAVARTFLIAASALLLAPVLVTALWSWIWRVWQ